MNSGERADKIKKFTAWGLLLLAWLFVLNGLGNSLVTIATNDPHVYAGVLRESIASAFVAAFLLTIVSFLAIFYKNIFLRLLTALGIVLVMLLVGDFSERAPYVFDGNLYPWLYPQFYAPSH